MSRSTPTFDPNNISKILSHLNLKPKPTSTSPMDDSVSMDVDDTLPPPPPPPALNSPTIVSSKPVPDQPTKDVGKRTDRPLIRPPTPDPDGTTNRPPIRAPTPDDADHVEADAELAEPRSGDDHPHVSPEKKKVSNPTKHSHSARSRPYHTLASRVRILPNGSMLPLPEWVIRKNKLALINSNQWKKGAMPSQVPLFTTLPPTPSVAPIYQIVPVPLSFAPGVSR